MTGKRNNITGKPARAKLNINSKVDLDATNPIPLEGKQAYSFTHNSAYLPFLSGLDNFGQVLLEARLLSVSQAACINTKTRHCAGNGFINADDNKDKFNEDFRRWLKNINLKNENVVKVNSKMFESDFQFGNTPIEVVRYNYKGEKRLFVYVHNFLEWRLCPPNDDGFCTHAIQSKLFLANRVLTINELKDEKKLPIYNPRNSDRRNWFVDSKGTERTLIWFKNEMSGYPNYGMPSSVGSLIYQILEYKGARFNLDGFINNWIASGILVMKGNVTPAENLEIAKKLIQTHTDDGNRGRLAVISSMAGAGDSEFHKVDNKTDGSYNESDSRWSEKIIWSNDWDAVLAGMISPSTLGKGEGFISKIYEIKQKTVIQPAQANLINDVWNIIFDIAREFLGYDIPENMAIKPGANISSVSDVDVTPAVSVDEVREANNLPKLGNEKGNMLMGELSAAQKAKTDVPSK